MIFRCFAVFDEKAKAYLTPFFLPEVGMAVRTIADCVNNPDHAFSRNPADYTLFELGLWDAVSGALQQQKIELVVSCVALRRVQS